MKLSYPYKKDANSDYSDDEILALLHKETTGHYLLGSHHIWHGGIHFTDKANAELKDKAISCIADGTIVAYRINRCYLRSEFAGDKQCSLLQYSSSFCLIRHEYESPPRQEQVIDKQQTENRETLNHRLIELTANRNARD